MAPAIHILVATLLVLTHFVIHVHSHVAESQVSYQSLESRHSTASTGYDAVQGKQATRRLRYDRTIDEMVMVVDGEREGEKEEDMQVALGQLLSSSSQTLRVDKHKEWERMEDEMDASYERDVTRERIKSSAMIKAMPSFLTIHDNDFDNRMGTNRKDDQAYRYRTFANIVQEMRNAAAKYPNLVKLDDAQTKFGLHSEMQCQEYSSLNATDMVSVPCKQYYVTLTNHQTWANEPTRPQMIVSGTLHGNERVGPHASIEFLLFVLEGYEKNDVWIKHLVDTRVVVIVPMTNANGFERNERMELQSNGASFDPNRDFPFNQESSNCMLTVAARTINELVRSHLFQVMITFHGGTNVVGYEWGDYSHCNDAGHCEVAPDDAFMAALATRIRNYAGSAGQFEEPYVIGTMGATVYPVNGGMEDWAYGASWEGEEIQCDPQGSSHPYSKKNTARMPGTTRCITYLVEAGGLKEPPEESLGTKEDVLNTNGKGNGHVPRNIRLLLAVVDALQPYMLPSESELTKVSDTAAKATVRMSPGGLFQVDSAFMQWSTLKASRVVQSGATGSQSLRRLEYYPDSLRPSSSLEYAIYFPLPLEEPIYFRGVIKADANLGSSASESHLVNARRNISWSYELSKTSKVTGSLDFYSHSFKISSISQSALSQDMMASKDSMVLDYMTIREDNMTTLLRIEMLPPNSVTWGRNGQLYDQQPLGGAGDGSEWAGVDTNGEPKYTATSSAAVGSPTPSKESSSSDLLPMIGIIVGVVAGSIIIIVVVVVVARRMVARRNQPVATAPTDQEMTELSSWNWEDDESSSNSELEGGHNSTSDANDRRDSQV